MKDKLLNELKTVKKRVDLQCGKHILMIILWTLIYFIVLFQPDSTIRTWVLYISVMAVFRRVWLHGKNSGVSDLTNMIIEGLESNEPPNNKFSAVLQEIGNEGIKVKIENKKAKEEQE